MEIADNGRGGAFGEGNGLSGMLERDGSAGTHLRTRVPV